VVALHRARGALALVREVEAAPPMAPVMPRAKGEVHFQIAIDRLLRSAAVDDYASSGVEVRDKLLVGLGRGEGYVLAARPQAVADCKDGRIEVDVERDIGE